MTVAVNHDYPHPGVLKAVAHDNTPIENAEVRIYTLVDFLAENYATPYAETTTDADGNWVDTIDLPDAMSWAVHFQKLDEVAPTHVEITT
jgi:hypothetical protein